jgi:hypothetical protein
VNQPEFTVDRLASLAPDAPYPDIDFAAMADLGTAPGMSAQSELQQVEERLGEAKRNLINLEGDYKSRLCPEVLGEKSHYDFLGTMFTLVGFIPMVAVPSRAAYLIGAGVSGLGPSAAKRV